MSIKYNKTFRRLLAALNDFIGNTFDSFMSLLYIGVLSSCRSARQCRKELCGEKTRACCVLGNGPSLKDAMERGEVKYKDSDVACVNMFCVSEYFEMIKPKYYFISDLVYFAPQNERHHGLIDKLLRGLNSVDWEMILVIPNLVPEGGRLLSEIKNDNIKVLRINTTRIEGFQKFCYNLYNRQLAVPQCENIVGLVLTKMVSWNYKTVYLYGADHSWTKDLFVDNDNVVCYGDRHVYDTNLSIVKMNHPLWIELRSFAIVFKAHMKIQEYAKEKECIIYNCTKESFIDAYTRLN